MKDVLMQQQINGFDDVYFTVGNIIMIIGGIISLAAIYFTLKYETKSHDKEIQFLKEELINSKNGRIAIKRELNEKIKEIDEHNRNRIDKTQAEMMKYKEKTDEEFKSINNAISKIQVDTSEIKGMLQILLNKKS